MTDPAQPVRSKVLSAAGAAALYVLTEIVCGDLAVADRHRQHVRERWAVWQAGYALLCDIDGTLYTYGVDQ